MQSSLSQLINNLTGYCSNNVSQVVGYSWSTLYTTSSNNFTLFNNNVRKKNYNILYYLFTKNVSVDLNRNALIRWYVSSNYKWNLPRLLLNNVILYYEVTKLTPTLLRDQIGYLSPAISNSWNITMSEAPVTLICGAGVLFGDFIFSDDEPLWEPVEWSFVQAWILFIFMFAWIGENLIGSRFGGYSGSDKSVWLSWYKTYWFVELGYIVSLGAASLFVIVPFYHELNYTVPFVFLWWDWYVSTFFFNSVSLFAIILLVATYLTTMASYNTWNKNMVVILIINLILSYLLYSHLVMAFFSYFTDPNWYHQTSLVDYVNLSHEPNNWAWGPVSRDHFSYHNSSTVFWYNNDGPFAASMMFFHVLLLLSLFTTQLYWIALASRVYSTQEVSYTYLTYCVSLISQFAYLLVFIYLLVLYSYLVMYWRLPLEYYSACDSSSWFTNLYQTLLDYPELIIFIFLK